MCINTAWGKKESPRTERLWSYIEDAKVSRDYKRIGRLLDSLIIIAEEDRMYDSMARALGGKVELLKFGSDVQQTLECLHQQRALLVKRNIRSFGIVLFRDCA